MTNTSRSIALLARAHPLRPGRIRRRGEAVGSAGGSCGICARVQSMCMGAWAVLRRTAYWVAVACVVGSGLWGCRQPEATSDHTVPQESTGRRGSNGTVATTSEAADSRSNGMLRADGTRPSKIPRDVGGQRPRRMRGSWPRDPEDTGDAPLPDAEIEARMDRPIEESVYDPALTKEQKLDLLLRHYHDQGRSGGPVDELKHHVMSEGMTHLEAAKYWAVQGGSREWALYHAEAELRRDPSSLEALALWARELPRGTGRGQTGRVHGSAGARSHPPPGPRDAGQRESARPAGREHGIRYTACVDSSTRRLRVLAHGASARAAGERGCGGSGV